MQLSLGHGAFQAEQQPVVELAGIIEPVLVADQRRAQRADLQQPVPVGVVTGQPGHLQAEHDPGPAHADLGDQVLEAFPVGGAGAGVALVDIDGDDLGRGPAQRGGPLPQRVLPGGGLGVVEDLLEGGLADIQVGVAGQVAGGHLRRVAAHLCSPPPGQARQRHRGQRRDQLVAGPGRCRAGRRGAGPRWCGSRNGLPGKQPGSHAAVLQHAQAQPPAAPVTIKDLAAQLLIPRDVVTPPGGLTAALRCFSGRRHGPARVPPSGDAR